MIDTWQDESPNDTATVGKSYIMNSAEISKE